MPHIAYIGKKCIGRLMINYIFKKGDTLADIARQYEIPLKRLEIDNNLPPNSTPNIGQAIMIMPPKQVYIVKEGDTLSSIAEAYGVTIIQLLRNNPDVSDRKELITGEELIISYDINDTINVMGYSSVFIQEQILRKTLPFLTYLTILNYRVDPLGNFQDINDTKVIEIALEYNVAPIMFLSSMTDSGRGSYAVTHSILNDIDIQDKLISNILTTLGLKGYMGLNLAFTHLLQEDLSSYVEFVSRVTEQLNQSGYVVFITLSPNTLRFQAGVDYNKPYFEEIGRATNYVILITYLWQEGIINLVNQTTPSYLKEYLGFVVTQIPPEKIMIGLTRIAYDWELPYFEGETIGSSLSNSGAIDLATQLGSKIEFDEVTQTPYFLYNISGAEHYVWFKDARAINAILDLVDEYGLYGVAVWSIMYYHSQTWLSINSRYNINTYDYMSLT
jgi:spore germination protein